MGYGMVSDSRSQALGKESLLSKTETQGPEQSAYMDCGTQPWGAGAGGQLLAKRSVF